MSGLIIVVLLGAVIVAIGARHLGVRWSSSGSGDTLVHLWRRAWPSSQLTWGQIEKRALGRILATVSSGVSGRVLVPARFTIRLSEQDHATLGDAIGIVTSGLADEVRRRAEAEGWLLTAGPVVEVVCDPSVYDGDPVVDASFSLGDAGAAAREAEAGLGHGHGAEATVRGAHDGMTRTMPNATAPPPSTATTAPEPVVAPEATVRHVAVPAHEGTLATPSAAPTLATPRPGAPAASDAPPELAFADGRRAPLPASSDEVRIGRSPGADVVLGDATVSGRHAALVRDGETWRVADLGSTNGTFVNGDRIAVGVDAAPALRDGDQIRFGPRGPVCSFGRTAADAPLVAHT